MTASAAHYYIRFPVCDVTVFGRSSLSANEISSTCLNSRLKYKYFRFEKTNVRHIEILFPVSIFAAIGILFCVMLPNFIQTGAPAAEI